MRWLTLIALALPLLVAIYTGNYALWCVRRRLWRGAAGLGLLALLTIGLPAWYELIRSR